MIDRANSNAAWQGQPSQEHLQAWRDAEFAASLPEGDAEDDEDEED